MPAGPRQKVRSCLSIASTYRFCPEVVAPDPLAGQVDLEGAVAAERRPAGVAGAVAVGGGPRAGRPGGERDRVEHLLPLHRPAVGGRLGQPLEHGDGLPHGPLLAGELHDRPPRGDADAERLAEDLQVPLRGAGDARGGCRRLPGERSFRWITIRGKGEPGRGRGWSGVLIFSAASGRDARTATSSEADRGRAASRGPRPPGADPADGPRNHAPPPRTSAEAACRRNPSASASAAMSPMVSADMPSG